MKRNNPALALKSLIAEIGAEYNSPAIELAAVDSVQPTVLCIGGAYVRRDIQMLEGVSYAAGDTVAVECVDGDYIILGKVVTAL